MNQEKKKNFIVNAIFYSIWVIIIFILLRFGLPALAPFVIAGVISLILKRPIEFTMKKLNISRKLAAIPIVLIFFSTAGLLVSLISIKLVSEIVALVIRVPDLYQSHVSPIVTLVIDKIRESTINLDPTLVASLEDLLMQFVQSIGELLSGLSVNVMAMVSSFSASLPGLFVEIVLLIISTFFITIDYDKLRDFFYRQLSTKTKSTFMEIKEYVFGTLFVCIRSYALIMSITCVELSIGFTIIGLNNAILIAILISIFDILPVLGTGGVMIPWILLSVLQGEYSLALGLLLVYITVTVIRNIIEPKIVGKQIGLHPILTLSSMFLGVQMFGVIGLFGFPIALSLFRHLNEKGILKVLKF